MPILEPPTSNDVPAPVARVAAVMSSYPHSWSLCGGWAVDAWLGRQTRDHSDVDIVVFQDDLEALRTHFDGWSLIAHDVPDPDSDEHWSGRDLILPAHIHVRREDGFDLDIRISEQADGRWVLSKDPLLALHLADSFAESRWAIPTLNPQVILFYKAAQARPLDETDFLALLPHLTSIQKSWLRDAITLVEQNHSWLTHLPPS